MAFYFRKLRTLQFMPTAKRSLGFGFSTRISESEKDKVTAGTADIESNASTSQTVYCTENEGGDKTEWSLLPELSKEAVLDLVPTLPTTSAIVPLTFTHIQSLLHNGGLVPRRRSSTSDLTNNSNKDILDIFSESVKPIHFTSDDIILSDTDHGGRVLVADMLLTKEAFDPEFSHSWKTSGGHFADTVPSGLEFKSDPSVHIVSSPHQNEKSVGHSSTGTCHTLLSSSNGGGPEGTSSSSSSASSSAKSSSSGPSPGQLQDMQDKLLQLVTTMFTGRHNYTLLHKNVTLENNLFGDNQVAVGTTAYSLAMLKLRLRVHARYSKVDMEVLSSTTLEQKGVIRLHWRLKGVRQAQLLKFWRLFRIDEADVEWVEAFSYFHIGKDGLVHKHRIDRTLPDENRDTNKLTEKLQSLLNPAKPLVS